MALKWYGDKVLKKMIRASKIGINKTMGHAVRLAKGNHPFQNVTGTAERSIRIAEQAVAVGNDVAGLWGSVAVNYFIFLEKKGFETLIPASQVAYPRLAINIREALK